MEKTYAVYMLASRPYGTLYIGVTGDLFTRVAQHRDSLIEGFTKKYGVTKLVWYEFFGDINEAILRETRMKRWRRDWKISLIEQENPRWCDLYPQLTTTNVKVVNPILVTTNMSFLR